MVRETLRRHKGCLVPRREAHVYADVVDYLVVALGTDGINVGVNYSLVEMEGGGLEPLSLMDGFGKKNCYESRLEAKWRR